MTLISPLPHEQASIKQCQGVLKIIFWTACAPISSHRATDQWTSHLYIYTVQQILEQMCEDPNPNFFMQAFNNFSYWNIQPCKKQKPCMLAYKQRAVSKQIQFIL